MPNNAEKIWNYFKNKGYTDAGVSGLIGNLFAESSLNPTNVQDNFEKKLKLSDSEYTKQVDSGKYKNFINDKIGYGLAQWTYWTRKKALLDFAKTRKTSIGDLDMQLDFLANELSIYDGLNQLMTTTKSIKEASNFILLNFEKPKNQSKTIQQERLKYSQKYYDLYAKGDINTMSNSSLVAYTQLSPNHSGKRKYSINRITPHCVVGQLSAEALGGWFSQKNAQSSSNYGIDKDGRIGLYVDEANRSWCSSSSDNDNRAITIECASDKTEPYRMNDCVYETLIKLCADICKRNGKNKLIWIPNKEQALAYKLKSNEMLITVHRWFANKSCPGDWLYGRLGDLTNKVNQILQDPIDKEEEEMTQEKFNEMMNVWLTQQAELEPAAWSKDARDWAESKGYIKGDEKGRKMYKKFITREEFMTVLKRALS